MRNAGAVFVGPYSPVSLGDYCAGSNHVLPTGGCACHSSGLSVQSFLKGIHIIEYNEPALSEVAPHVVALANAEDLPAHGEAVLARRQPGPWSSSPSISRHRAPWSPSDRARAHLAGPADPGRSARLSPYGAPQLDVPVLLNTNENPYPPSAALVADLAQAASRAAAGANRYPDRDAEELRKDLAQYLGHGLVGANLWAANGSNEIIQQILQCFGGFGRSALGFEPSYSMHRLIALATGTDLDLRAALRRLHAGPGRRRRRDRAAPAGSGVPDLAEQPDRHRRADGADRGDRGRGARHGRDRRGVRGVLPPRHPVRAHAAPGPPAADRHPHDVEGLRHGGRAIGYLAADPAVVDALLLVRLPYHLSSFTQAVARTALAHTAELLGTVDAVKGSATASSMS